MTLDANREAKEEDFHQVAGAVRQMHGDFNCRQFDWNYDDNSADGEFSDCCANTSNLAPFI